jgi:deazaflavin-dependent oxidoreductase (nitroreductase family)
MAEHDIPDTTPTTGRSTPSQIPTYAEVQEDPTVLTAFNDDVVAEFRANAGRVGGPFADADIVLLTMTGAKSGRRRLTPLEYFAIDGRILLLGTYGGAPKDPAWVHNLRADASVHVEIGTESYDATARELTGAERDELFDEIVEMSSHVEHYPTPTRPIPLFELLAAPHHAPTAEPGSD